MKQRTCPFCHSTGVPLSRSMPTLDRFEEAVGLDADNHWRMWLLCQSCQGAWVEVAPQSRGLLASVATAYYEVDLGGKDGIEKKFRMVLSMPRSDNGARVDRVCDFVSSRLGQSWTRGGDLLDIGSGLGVFPHSFRDSAPPSWRITVVESDPLACDHLSRLDGIGLVRGTFPNDDIGGNFSLITLNKVLEHVDDPVYLLRQCAQHLESSDAVLYVEVPSSRNFKQASDDDNSLGSMHLHLHSCESLNLLAQAAGLKTIESSEIEESSGKLTVYAFMEV